MSRLTYVLDAIFKETAAVLRGKTVMFDQFSARYIQGTENFNTFFSSP